MKHLSGWSSGHWGGAQCEHLSRIGSARDKTGGRSWPTGRRQTDLAIFKRLSACKGEASGRGSPHLKGLVKRLRITGQDIGCKGPRVLPAGLAVNGQTTAEGRTARPRRRPGGWREDLHWTALFRAVFRRAQGQGCPAFNPCPCCGGDRGAVETGNRLEALGTSNKLCGPVAQSAGQKRRAMGPKGAPTQANRPGLQSHKVHGDARTRAEAEAQQCDRRHGPFPDPGFFRIPPHGSGQTAPRTILTQKCRLQMAGALPKQGGKLDRAPDGGLASRGSEEGDCG